MSEIRAKYTPSVDYDQEPYRGPAQLPGLRAKTIEVRSAIRAVQNAIIEEGRITVEFMRMLQDALTAEQQARLEAEQDCQHWEEKAEQLKANLEAEIDQLRVHLAGCSVAALGGSPVAMQGDYGWSPAYQDVLDLRARYEALQTQVSQLAEALEMAMGVSST